jgi:ATP-dependent DNA helicase RecQ
MLAARFNTRKGKIDQILKILETESPSPVTREGYRWFPTPVEWSYDAEHAERLTAVRRHELEQMTAYVDTTECLQVFLARELDAPDLEPCGKCANCMGNPIIETAVDPELISMALEYLKRLDLPIVPRKRWPGDALETDHGWMGSIAPGLQVTEGRALCRWGDPGWGALVRDGKHGGHFDTGLVEAAVDLINQRWHPEARAEWVTCVPSLRHGALVPDFARRLADRLDLPFVECVEKVRETRPQKGMNDSWNQARNLADAFATRNEMIPGGSVLLIDDMVDSKWTFTIVGALLREGGAGPVLPFALADTSQTGD